METSMVGLTTAQVQSLLSASISQALSQALPLATNIATVRPFNSAFQPSTAHDSIVTYSVKITTTATIGSGQDGDVFLEVADDSAFTANVQTLGVVGNSQTVSLAVALQSVQGNTSQLTGVVPQSKWARLRTVSNTGTPTFTYRAGQEVPL